ncbi:DUF4214 domain-containing protein [Candidatus Arthromitus sp. SFB-turkey]|uniref:DUF4214 domain-containing protein n=1 Tax=Candidatus Arthromitus sp. SFB-turkey TaxID=1840217 RepID=UPI0007F44F1F|nr:DUF4214 domain-containing protein [Candidatus Arthromitus sp. SFB-turkey]OAT86997.1 hypothetical protein A6P36_01765 [Candidatus Arthromitus sp. SFB-turkey]
MSDHIYVFSNKAYKDSQEQEKLKIDTKKLPTLKVENIKVDSKLRTCVRVSTDNLFRGNILEFPIIDVIINDRFVEITGLIVGKLYSGLVLNLEYISGNKLYLLEDFVVEAGDVISEYICTTYKLALKRDVEEEEFNEWYFKLQREADVINDFIRNIVMSDEFSEVNKGLDSFIEVLHKVVFRRSIDEDTLNYWKNKYSERILEDTDDEVRDYIIEQMIQYKQFEYLIGK